MVTVTNIEIPSWATRLVPPDGKRAVEDAIADAERSTSGEIVPMLVRCSSPVGHVWVILTLALLLIYLFAERYVGIMDRVLDVKYGSALFALMPLVLGAFAYFLSRLPFIQRLLTLDGDLETQVLRRAEIEFFEAGLNKTGGATGILLFVSLMEHRAIVLADKSIAAKLPPETWKGVVDHLVSGIKRGDAVGGFRAAIEACGVIAAEHFPILPNDRNELRNNFIIKE